MTEITDFGAVILLVAGGFALAVLSTRLTERVPIPAPAIFLLAAAVASDLWTRLYESVPILTVERLAVVALIVILFNGGIDIGLRRLRAAAGPILSLGILGTFATAGLMALFAHYALGFSWTLAGIIGSALAPTDPAVVFSVLGNREIGGRAGTTLEGEAGVNDPAGVALMVGMIELATHDDATLLVVVREFAVEMAIGTVIGILGAFGIVWILRHFQRPGIGLYPLFSLVLAGALYGITVQAKGSGFLAVFVAGIVVGDAALPNRAALERFHVPLAALAELVVFVGLGLTVSIGGLEGRVWVHGILLTAALAVAVRPGVVLASLAPFRFTWAERVFITWSGLKGAVPILLAAFAVLGSVRGAERVYGLVFVVVLLSVVVQGTLVPVVARMLRIPTREHAET
jgi:cell volume regulation protein A